MPNNEAEIEAAIVAAGKTAPRIRPEDLDAQVAAKLFWQPEGTTLTVCVLVMKNGFTLVGESAAADPNNFDEAIGQRIAFENARNKMWPLLGYQLREELFLRSLAENERSARIMTRHENIQTGVR